MRKAIPFLMSCVIAFFAVPILAQNKVITVDHDYKHWYQEYIVRRRLQCRLPDLSQYHCEQSWRFWNISNKVGLSAILDIYQYNSSRCKMFLTLYTEDFVDSENPAMNRLFYKKFKIGREETTQILALLKTVNINSQPSTNGDTIQSAEGRTYIRRTFYVDGIPPQLEYSGRYRYTYKLFYNKEQEAVVRRFQDSVRHILNSDRITAWFIKRIPFEFFHTEYDMQIGRQILTDKKKLKYKLEWDRYRKRHGLQ